MGVSPARGLLLSALGLDAAQLGVRAGAADDQSEALQRAIDQAANSQAPLALGPGVYRVADLRLPARAQLVGVRGATRLVLSRGTSLISAERAEQPSLSDLVLDGAGLAAAPGRGLVHFVGARAVRIQGCDIARAAGAAIMLEQCSGEVTNNTVTGADVGVHSLDARGLTIGGNNIVKAGNNGIQVWQSSKRDDGTLVVDNRIEDTAARGGGSGQNGNAINVFRAGNVIVRGNRIRNAAFSAVRGNAASNIVIANNSCSGLGEVAIYAEFDFEGAVIANNAVDDAALGVSVTNFKQGGRLALVQGNLIRNVTRSRPAGTDPNDSFGVGIGVEADTAVTGNVIENAPNAGIAVGWGEYQRDVAVSDNIVRRCGYGITVSVAPGAGGALIANNLISAAARGAIVGMEWKKAVSGDLVQGDTSRYPQLSVHGNQSR
jgi:uncharacterized secreted repeat protein (TIGR03808 family)